MTTEQREKKRLRDKRYYQTHREGIIAQVKERYRNNQVATCSRENLRQMTRKLDAIEQLGGVCMTEGCDETHPVALQFHHRDPSIKKFMVNSKTLSSPKKYPWKEILLEIAKCDLLCANCHSKVGSIWDIDGRVLSHKINRQKVHRVLLATTA